MSKHFSTFMRIGISALLLTVIAWRTDWSVVGDKFVNLNVWLWLASVAVLSTAVLFSAKRWQLFAQELNFERSLGQYCAYCFIGMWFNLSLPTSVGGDVVRVWYLDGQSGRKLAAFASIALERLNGLIVLICVACVGVLIAPMELPAAIQISVWSVAGGAVLVMLSLPIVRNWKRMPRQRREQVKAVLDTMRHPQVMMGATLMSILVQLAGVVSLWLITLALDLPIPFAYCCILGPMVSLLTLLPISVNGMGVRELGTVVFLAPLGIHEDMAKTLAFLWFMVNVAVSLEGGLVYLFGAYPKAQTPVNEGATDGSLDRDSDQGREGQHPKAA